MQIYYDQQVLGRYVAWESDFNKGEKIPIDPRLLIPILTHNAAHRYFESKTTPSREVACLGLVSNSMLPIGLKHPNPSFEMRRGGLNLVEMIEQSPLGILHIQLHILGDQMVYENPDMTVEHLSSMIGTLPLLLELANK